MITDLLFIVSSGTSCAVHNEAASYARQVIGKGRFPIAAHSSLRSIARLMDVVFGAQCSW
jgi:hypothetical protein